MAKKPPKNGSPAKPPAAGGPAAGSTQDVNRMKVADAATIARVKAAAGVTTGPGPAPAARAAPAPQPPLATKPGVERWPVKTGTDPDVGEVAQQIIPTTVEELITIPRPANMVPVTSEFPEFQEHRVTPTETTIWQIDATITALKQEADGDYHLVLQGESGETMIGEVPTPRPPFVDASSPWLDNIKAARAAVDSKLVKPLKPQAFVPMGNKLVPRGATLTPTKPTMALPESFATPAPGAVAPAFKTRVKPTPARITGVGFFDKVHGQMGVSQFNGIELHPILKIEWQ